MRAQILDTLSVGGIAALQHRLTRREAERKADQRALMIKQDISADDDLPEDPEVSWFVNGSGELFAVIGADYYAVDVSGARELHDLDPGEYETDELAHMIRERVDPGAKMLAALDRAALSFKPD